MATILNGVAGLSDIILKGDPSRTIQAKFGLIWFNLVQRVLRRFKCESLQRTTEGQQVMTKLTNPLASRAKNDDI
jgi:hypothetical protein